MCPKVGDIVLVFEESLKKRFWKIARIERLIKGKDDIVRVAEVKIVSKVRPLHISRPLQKLYPLEIDAKVG